MNRLNRQVSGVGSSFCRGGGGGGRELEGEAKTRSARVSRAKRESRAKPEIKRGRGLSEGGSVSAPPQKIFEISI